MPSQDELWYAAKATEVVFAPPKLLETFGETCVDYFVLAEVLDAVNQLRIRKGRVTAQRPRVLLPRYLANQALENFGEEAKEYAEHFLHSQEGIRIIQYGMNFKKEEYSEETVQGEIREVADQISKDAEKDEVNLCGVIIGVDDLWEVSLFHFISDLVHRSLPHNAREMAGHGLLDLSGGVPNAVRVEIQNDFRAAEGDREQVTALGEKLRSYGLFDEYQDRFFELYSGVR